MRGDGRIREIRLDDARRARRDAGEEALPAGARAVGRRTTGRACRRTIRDKIFYPLVSGREGGSGLGLTIAQTFVAQHNGTIEWESAPGRTVFTILLPLEMTRGRG